MKKTLADAFPLIRFLLIIIFLIGYHQKSNGAVATHTTESSCPEGSIILEQEADAPVKLSIQKAVCDDYCTRIDLKLENISSKPIVLYEISHSQDYEKKKGITGLDITGGLIKPGESINVNVNGGVRKSYQKVFGTFKTVAIKLSWVKFSDGTLWGEDYGRSNLKAPKGYDLVLRDDKEPFSASFEFENNTFAITSETEYGFGGSKFNLETIGCKKHLTFDFEWKDYDFSYHPRNKPEKTIIIKAGDNLHGDFIYDSCTKTAAGTIRDENQNLTLMNLNGTNINLRNSGIKNEL